MTRTLLLIVLLLPTAVFAQEIALEAVATNVNNVVSIAHAGDSRLFLVEQSGQIKVWTGPNNVLSAPFLDLRTIVSCCGERGLLGLAFHPRYAQNGFFYVNYTDLNGHTVIARYSVSSTNPDRANAASAQVLLRVNQPFANHNGGQLAFGPDGYLYIGLGDGGSGGDPGNRAQDMSTLLGKMLRIDVDSGSPYGIPPSNPFLNSAHPEIWALGLRNPWRYSFDRYTGNLWIADVGQGEWEEVNFQSATSTGGENYGWRRMEGSHCFNPGSNCNPGGTLVLPVIEYEHTGNLCSVTGGYVYRGSRYPRLHGTYVYGDFCVGVIFGALRHPASGAITTRTLLDTNLFISTFGEDVNGELYVADWRANGTIYRITDPHPLPAKRRSVSKNR